MTQRIVTIEHRITEMTVCIMQAVFFAHIFVKMPSCSLSGIRKAKEITITGSLPDYRR